MALKKYCLEYSFRNVSPKQLWVMLSTEFGLSSWIEADVKLSDDIACFHWSEQSFSQARYRVDVAKQHVFFEWLDEDGGFSLQISSSELTKEVNLLIADECREEDHENTCQIWQRQVGTLQRVLGLSPS